MSNDKVKCDDGKKKKFCQMNTQVNSLVSFLDCAITFSFLTNQKRQRTMTLWKKYNLTKNLLAKVFTEWEENIYKFDYWVYSNKA